MDSPTLQYAASAILAAFYVVAAIGLACVVVEGCWLLTELHRRGMAHVRRHR